MTKASLRISNAALEVKLIYFTTLGLPAAIFMWEKPELGRQDLSSSASSLPGWFGHEGKEKKGCRTFKKHIRHGSCFSGCGKNARYVPFRLFFTDN